MKYSHDAYHCISFRLCSWYVRNMSDEVILTICEWLWKVSTLRVTFRMMELPSARPPLYATRGIIFARQHVAWTFGGGYLRKRPLSVSVRSLPLSNFTHSSQLAEQQAGVLRGERKWRKTGVTAELCTKCQRLLPWQWDCHCRLCVCVCVCVCVCERGCVSVQQKKFYCRDLEGYTVWCIMG